MKIIAEGTPNEIAALIDAIQELPEIRAIRNKKFEDLETKDFARMVEFETPKDGVCTGTDILPRRR